MYEILISMWAETNGGLPMARCAVDLLYPGLEKIN